MTNNENPPRSRVKKSIQNVAPDDKELTSSLVEARKIELEITKENNRHAKDMLGLIGRVFGHEGCAPVNIAALVVVVGIAIFVICTFYGLSSSDKIQDSIFRYGEKGIALAATGLAYIFGRAKK